MAIGYTPTTWVDNSTLVDATRLNNMEGGIKSACDAVDSLSDVATSGDAEDVGYDNTSSGLTATNVQTAIDENTTAIASKADSSDLADYLPLTGGTLTGALEVSGDIIAANDAITAPSGDDLELYTTNSGDINLNPDGVLNYNGNEVSIYPRAEILWSGSEAGYANTEYIAYDGVEETNNLTYTVFVLLSSSTALTTFGAVASTLMTSGFVNFKCSDNHASHNGSAFSDPEIVIPYSGSNLFIHSRRLITHYHSNYAKETAFEIYIALYGTNIKSVSDTVTSWGGVYKHQITFVLKTEAEYIADSPNSSYLKDGHYFGGYITYLPSKDNGLNV